MTNHVIVVLRDPDGEFAPDVEIECPGVTDACAEWIECKVADCPANTGGDDTFYDVSDVAHGEQHRYIDDTWMIRTGFCYAENHGHDAAGQFVERHQLGAGRYEVVPEFDDGILNDFVMVGPKGVCQCSSFPMAGGAADCPNHVPGAAPVGA